MDFLAGGGADAWKHNTQIQSWKCLWISKTAVRLQWRRS
tara:strand:+ start:702 stop:818 length:117 start_codon:yes stop_codon:yes gene_type:complete